MSKRNSTPDLESPAAIAVVDDILAGVGLRHGSRASRRDSWSDGERRPVGVKKEASVKAAVLPTEMPRPLLAPSLQDAEALVHGFSTRAGGVSRCYRPHLPASLGDLDLGFTKQDDPANVCENRRRFLQSISADGFDRFASLHQLHTPVVRVFRSAEEAADDFLRPATMRGDAALTNVPGVLLTVQAADCVPILVFDRCRRAIGCFHAGWRGTLARIVQRGIGSMKVLYNSDPEDIVAVIGPSIGPASYAVSEEIRHEFVSQFAYGDELFADVYDSDPVREKYPLLFLTARAPGHSPIGPQLHLDLWEANRRQLVDAGVPVENITVTAEDTAADTGTWFSHRAEDGFTGRMMGAIGMTA